MSEEPDEDKEKVKDRKPLAIGGVVTGLWIWFMLYLFSRTPSDKWMKLGPNEVGDLLAGVAAPLAFCWLVVAVFVQRRELQLQRLELKESRKAQRDHVNETKGLVDQNRASVQLATEANAEAGRSAQEERLNKLVDLLSKRLALRWRDFHKQAAGMSGWQSLLGTTAVPTDPDDIITQAIRNLALAVDGLSVGDTPVYGDVMLVELYGLKRWMQTLSDAADTGSFPVLQARVEMLEIYRLARFVDKLIAWIEE